MASAKPGMLKLMAMIGGRQATVDAINTAKDEARDESAPVTMRQLHCWIYRDSMPAYAHFYLLAAAAQKGIDLRAACGAYPDLLPAARIIGAIYKPKVAA